LRNTDEINIVDLPVELRQMKYQPVAAVANTHPPTRQKITRAGLLALLGECDWNKAEVSRRLGKSRTSVWKYMKKWDISIEAPQ